MFSTQKSKLKKTSESYLSTFKKVIVGLKKANTEISNEEKREEVKIREAKINLSDYASMKKENTNVITGLETLLNGNVNPNVTDEEE